MPTPITDKHEMYRRLNAGLLGNTIPAAETFAAALAFMDRVPGPYAIRYKSAGGKTKFGLCRDDAVSELIKIPEGTWNLSRMVNDSDRICYGHLWDDVDGWNLHYSSDPKPCKLKEYLDGCSQRNLRGLAAQLYLRGIMDQIGWETLLYLVDAYPDHVVEFSVFAVAYPLTLSWSNTCFWEVRMTGGVYERGSEWDK